MSAEYWNNRYKKKFNSGIGSKLEQGEWRLNIITDLYNIYDDVLLDYGCGDLSLWSLDGITKLPSYYIGIDYSTIALAINKKKFPKILWYTPKEYENNDIKVNIAICLDVFIHQIEFNDAVVLINNLCRKTQDIIVFQNWKYSPFITNTDNKYQIYRNTSEYMPFFKNHGFKLINVSTFKDGLNALYTLKRVYE